LRFSLTRLLPDQISGHLEKILQAESIPADEPAIMRIARAADGSMRDGLSLLDQAIAYGGGSLKDADVASMLGSIDHAHITAIIDALSRSDASALMTVVKELVQQSRNLETALDELAEAMHRIALIQAAPDFRDPVRDDWDSLTERASQISPEDAQLYYQIAITGRRDMGMAPDPRTGLEMTLLRMLAFRPADAGSGGAIPVSKPVVASTQASSSGQVTKPKQNEVSGGGSEAARAARAAFDELHKPKTTAAVKPKTPAPVMETQPTRTPDSAPEPQAGIEAGPSLEMGSQAGSDAGQTMRKEEGTPAEEWSNLQSNLELSGAAREFARNIQLESVDENRWRFLVPDTLLQLGSEKVVQSLQTALSSNLGHPVKLDLHKASEPVKSVAEAAQRAEVNRMSEAERAIDEDPTVKEIKKKFAAKIIPDSIQPLQ
jgi:DNA polymerase-3 subunit gamma/tau